MAITPRSDQRQPAATEETLSFWLRGTARAHPSTEALVSGNSTLTYQDLATRVTALAKSLREADLAPGDLLAIAASRSIDTVVTILAALEAGIGYVPLDLSYPADRLRMMLAEALPRAVMGDPEGLTALTAQLGAMPSLAAPLPRPDHPVYGVGADTAYVLFTSGSTGKPKGVSMGRGPLAKLIAWHATHPRLQRAARTLLFAPLSFDVHFQEIASTLITGGTLVLIDDATRRDPARLRQAIADHQVDRLFLPYVALQMLAQADAEARRQGLPALALRDVISAGEQLQITPDIEALFESLSGEAVLHNHYGPTETHVVTAYELTGAPDRWPRIPAIGSALPHVEMALRDPETQQVTLGDTGELLLGGPCLAQGYIGQVALTEERFLTAPAGLLGRWYASGDLVRKSADGSLVYLGRADQQLKVDGFRIEPGDIELALMAHPSIKDAAVTAPDIPGVGRQLVAHVVLRHGVVSDPTALQGPWRAWLRERVPEYMVPARFMVLDHLPSTPSGKIDRRQLPLPDAQGAALTDEAPLIDRLRALWQELLGQPGLDDHANVFDLGARSLLVLRFVTRLQQAGVNITVADVYDQPTVAGLHARLTGSPMSMLRPKRPRPGEVEHEGMAIVGMALRAGNIRDVDTFWQALLDGQEFIRHFKGSDIDPGIPAEMRQRANFVAARGVLDDADRFDAGFFGISAREATMLDPQQRLFLELCWSALEHAGIVPTASVDRIGVYAGTANNTYLPHLRQAQPELVQQYGEFATMLASEKDYVATRAANRLNLRGPAVSIHTACSTSLVAITQAWHALASGQCDVALAGGVTVVVPQAGGYLHVEGGMESADGHCRPFDAEASGTVFSSGGAVVVLKPLHRAQADGDTIYGVIQGVGLNNDGGEKASFTAPSVSGQAQAIRMALDHAGASARSIGYVEAHGTGTSLGDPIEVAALTQAWAADTADRQFCRLGSVKGHLGHMVAAAGVMGLIKATLSMHHQCIPATLHYKRPNPQIDFSQTPFHVVGQNTPWPQEEAPRRAAVSSFGVGGTNAHVILEEAPSTVPQDAGQAARLYLLPLSARSPEAAQSRARDLAGHLRRHPTTPLAPVFHTLVRGRQAMSHRLCVVAHDALSAADALDKLAAPTQAATEPRLVFMFPGQGSQHPGMARQLCEDLPAFREAFDACLAAAPEAIANTLRQILIDAAADDAQAAQTLAETRYAQPALFSVSYSLGCWLLSLGVKPAAMIGHSIGEFAAACHAGVMSVDDAMRSVIARGQAMFEQPRGAMLAVRTSAAELSSRLIDGIEIAAVNAPSLTVVAGPVERIDAFALLLEGQDIGTTRLKVSHGFHSAAMDGALPKVERALAQARLSAPSTRIYSCLSGDPLTAKEAMSPVYWARQVRGSVQFSRAVQAEISQPGTVLVEVGPGQALTALARQHRTADGKPPITVATQGPSNDPGDASARALQTLGALWCQGTRIDWPVAASARRVPLPTYPFHGSRYWFKTTAAISLSSEAEPRHAQEVLPMSRIPRIEQELARIIGDVSGLSPDALSGEATFVDQGLDSLSLTQATLELERVFGVKLRFRRLLEDLDTMNKLAVFLDAQMSPERFAAPAAAPTPPEAQPLAQAAPAPAAVPAPAMAWPVVTSQPGGTPALQQLIQQQMQLMSQQLALLAGQPMPAPAPVGPANAPAAIPTGVSPLSTASALAPSEPAANAQPAKNALIEKPFGASARIVLDNQTDFTPAQRQWVDEFIAAYNLKTGASKTFSQANRKLMADPRVVTGFNPLWKDLVYPIVADRSKGAYLWDVDGNRYIDLLSCFGANLLGYQPDDVLQAMVAQLHAGIEVGPQHPLAADVARLISEFTGMERVAFCNTGSEAVMGAMRIARTVTGRKTIAIFTNSYHGIFDEVIVRGTRQLRSLSAAPGILANAVENILVLDYDSDESLRVLKERGHELAAIMIEPIQNKYPTLQPQPFVQALRHIADEAGCALIFDEVVTGFRVAPGGAQEFYGVRADIATYGKVIGGGLPFAAIAGASHWLDALDGGHWQYGDGSYPEAGVTYFAGTFVRHPLALAAAKASLEHLKRGGKALYASLHDRTQRMIDRLNAGFELRKAPVKAVHCASLWRLSWDDNLKYVSLFYYLARYHGLHLYEQFGHFVTEAMGDEETDRIVEVFLGVLDELMALGFLPTRDGSTPPSGGGLPRQTIGEAPLSPGQTERWLAAAYDPAACRALNESFCVSLSGPVDVALLKQAIRHVLDRHDAFRIRFDLNEPRQILQGDAVVDIAEVDLRQQPEADAALDAFCTQASQTQFALDRAPLVAVSIVYLADGRVVVHVVASHLVFDGWASSVFNAELAASYKALRQGTAVTLPEAESPLRFALQEQARTSGPEGADSLAYWQNVLRQAPALLTLGDRNPPTPRQYRADTLRARIDGPALSTLRAVAREQGSTLFQLLLAAVATMLSQRSGQTAFVISIPYASQSLQRHGPLMADGVLDLPLLLNCQADDTPRSLTQRIRTQLMDAADHPLVTQGNIARALGRQSAGDRPPFTGIYFNLNPRIDLSDFSPLGAQMHEGRKQGTLSELFFNFYESPDNLSLDLHYSTEFFSPACAQGLVDSLVSVCHTFAQGADQLLLQRPSGLAEASKTHPDPRVCEWNQTHHPHDPAARIEQWVTAQANRTPDAPALLAQGVRLSYRELEQRANRFANLLITRGIGAGDLVGVCTSRGPDMVPALLGILKTGAAYVPLDPGFPKERLHYMASDAALKLVITEARHADRAGVDRSNQIRIDDDANLLMQASVNLPTPLRPITPSAIAYVIYTSGSTGHPKGVVLPQSAVCNFLSSMQREPGLTAADRLLAVTTLSFDIAVLELFLPLVTGAQVVLAQREDAIDGEALGQLIAQERITVMQATPTTWHMLMEMGWRAPSGFKALCGGEPLPPSLAHHLLAQGIELWNMYGPTETTVWSTLAHIRDASDKITIGRPIANTQVWILDEQLQPCPIGAEGEICIGGDGVAMGYFKRPELTADRFVRDPFRAAQPGARIYRTGDLGRWREDGRIDHLGRLDFQVKIRGYRIELGEIEARLAAQPGVGRTVVVAREDTPGDVRLVGYCTVQPGHALDPDVLRQSLRVDLPDYMVPQHIVVLPQLPQLPNGKIDRKGLPAPTTATMPEPVVEAKEAPVVPAIGKTSLPLPALEQGIALAMAEVLGKPLASVHDNFFELGGHSLLAARLAAKLIEVVGFRPTLRTLFESPTPAALAQALSTSATAKTAASIQQPGLIPVRSDQSHAPLSQMQQRLWFLEMLSPGTVANNTPSTHRLIGELDLAAFDAAIGMLIARQSALRTVIERTPTGAVQRVLPALNYHLPPVIDLSGLPEAERQAAFDEALMALVNTPFDLEQGPLFAARLWRLGPQEHAFFFQTHHLIWDGWSFDVLYQELSELYEACRTHRPPQLPALTVSYGDFSAWQNEWLSGEELRRQTRYWCEQLSPLPEPLDLPLDHPRPAIMSGRGGSLLLKLEGHTRLALRQHAQRNGRTLYVTLLAAFSLALHQLTQQNDLVIGTPVRGREQPGLEPLMGFFVNMLPVRMRIDARQTLSNWLDQVHRHMIEAYACPDVPFEHLVRELNVPRDTSYTPIFQVAFSYQDARDRRTDWGNLRHERMTTPILGSAQDIGLWCVETDAHIEFAFTYNSDVLEQATVERLGARIIATLHAMEQAQDKPLSLYLQLPASEQSLLDGWNATHTEHDRQALIHQLTQAQAARTPDHVALVQPGWGQLTYRELDARANRLARMLRQRGVGRGALVGLCVERGADMLTAQLAILKAGAAYVPLDPAYPTDRLTYMGADARLDLLVTEQAHVHALPWPREQTLLLDLDAAAIAALSDQALPPEPQRDARPEDPAYVIYTSGSTGQPKGVVVPHHAVVNFLHSMARQPGMRADDRLLAVTTLSFDIAVLELLLPLVTGAQVVVASQEQTQDGNALNQLLASHQISVMQATPSTWHMLLSTGWQGHPQFKALVGGEALTPDLARQLLTRSAELWNMYGPTETTVWSTCERIQAEASPISIGRPIANTQVHVLDAYGQRCPIGVPGELCIGGEGVTSGYLYRPELTAERFIVNAFSSQPGDRLYRTGDRARWLPDGRLEHLGRLDFQVKVRGHRIELGEIEAALAQHPDVSRTVVIVREDTPGDARLVAYIVPAGDMPSIQAIKEHLRTSLPDYMLPQHVVEMTQIPLLPNGKINRKALPPPNAPVHSAQENGQAPSAQVSGELSPTEQAIAEVWKKLLGLQHVAGPDNFFDLGGHSLLAMRAVTEINRVLGTQLTVRQLIFGTLEQLAKAAPASTPAEAEMAAQASAATMAPAATPAAAATESGWLRKLVGRFLP